MLAVMERTLALLDRLHIKHGPATAQSGEAGERAAYFHIRRQGYAVVARRWRHAFLDGEIDLIAWDGNTLCFIEVKTRAASTPFAAEFHVDEAKQAALQRMAQAYISQLPWTNNQQPASLALRFDVASVYLNPNGTTDVRLVRDAFR
jgi:putative endonuclease